jgi:hypothetical protein
MEPGELGKLNLTLIGAFAVIDILDLNGYIVILDFSNCEFERNVILV